jgi:hypothetical protein
MNLKLHSLEARGEKQRSKRGIALVITLLMLSVITFLAVAFLAMTRRDRAAVTATMDVDGARNMSDAALNRAQAEVMARMIAQGDALSYDYMVSRNFISPGGFINKNSTLTNVNYDFFFGSTAANPVGNNAAAWAENIGNLYYDPRPPVFVVTNPAYPASNDFRFWVDIDRNGRFETNGYLPYMTDNGLPTTNYEYFNGEPEWIGVLRDPMNRHSPTNQFIGRYAYMVLPIGKTLDLNYIHNWLKGYYSDSVASLTNNFAPTQSDVGRVNDGFARDQGMGPWELNLAAMLDVLSPDAYQYGFPGAPLYQFSPYQYYPPTNGTTTGPNLGSPFADAESMLHYRYYPPNNQPNSWSPVGSWPYYIMANLNQAGLTTLTNNDVYCVAAPTTNDYIPTTGNPPKTGNPWPGSYTTNMFYDPQDLFDPTKTSAAFTNRLALAGSRTNSEDRYTFERLLANIGTGSQPEYGVWVYGDNGQQVLRTKVNINYDNTAQLTNGPYTPMPTNLVNWTPLGFFTNAAELLLRSQTFIYTNYTTVGNSVSLVGVATNLYFGVTNIPVFRAYFNGVQYNEAVHRMLQLAANIYSDTISNSYPAEPVTTTGVTPKVLPPPVRLPFVFQPLFGIVGTLGSSNWGVNITGFSNVVGRDVALTQIQKPFVDLTSNNLASGALLTAIRNGYNFSGIPWVISAEKGLPQFYQYTLGSRILFARKVMFCRGTVNNGPDTNHPPVYTNQFFVFGISNDIAIGSFNPYQTAFTGSFTNGGGFTYYLSNYVTVELTNNYNYGFVTNTNYVTLPTSLTTTFDFNGWPGDLDHPNNPNGFITFLSNNIISIPSCYFSESTRRLVFFTNAIMSSNSFLASDTNQQTWAVHNWVLSITNHMVYALFDGPAATGTLLDFVNLGPFGFSTNLTQMAALQGDDNNGGLASSAWNFGNAGDVPTAPPYRGLVNQVNKEIETDSQYENSLTGHSPNYAGWFFDADYNPSNAWNYPVTYVANDPLVHYTIGDLSWQGSTAATPLNIAGGALLLPMTNVVGLSTRYQPWGRTAQLRDMLVEDPQIASSSAWQFPSNKFPSIGWLGRVHRGTPWQTVYFKSDNPAGDPSPEATWLNGPEGSVWANSLDTYPTNDWVLPDLFTTAPNDNAARGLLSVNQTNDAAWAAVLSGVIMPTNSNGSIIGVPIGPTNVYSFVDGPGGINAARATNNVNGLFHKLGYILAAPALTVGNMFLTNSAPYSDEAEERIPQQVLGLLKVGEPQFVIYAWGESLRPKSLYLTGPANIGICTNYEITGEFLSRTVCHVVHTNGVPKMVVDSYNIEPSN